MLNNVNFKHLASLRHLIRQAEYMTATSASVEFPSPNVSNKHALHSSSERQTWKHIFVLIYVVKAVLI